MVSRSIRALATGVLAVLAATAAVQPPRIAIDYPTDGSVFPPDFAPPTFIWRDLAATTWEVEAAGLRVTARAPRMRVGEIDPRAVAPSNRPPSLSLAQSASRTWTPDGATWEAIKQRSLDRPIAVTLTGFLAGRPVSRGQVTLRISADPVGAPIFYRDVPLMPSETQKGVNKPLAASGVPLIAWRLRNVSESRSRLLMEGLHTCANCHSVSNDGKTMGMDVDGPQNDKGLYAVLPIRQHTSIRNEDIVAWSTFRGKLGGKLRVGFMSQVSPDGAHVVTTINDPGADQSEYARRKSMRDVALNYYVADFKDYRFLQVFYPTRGVLAWYSRATGRLQPLPGADDPRYVHTNAVWSPDGKYLVFARAEARDPYPAGAKPAAYANDANETPIRYDLYRIPFNNGEGGRAEPVAGASANGMSNSFPKVSPDGRWIVWVQSRNGQLMRPDSTLWIVPAAGGQPRRMRCNTRLMNSWHSFSPNGRWMVFSSKSRSPYTQMFLTHIDAEGNDSPAILIENATAANRAVNIPEFLNIAPDGLVAMDAPATAYYRVVDRASELARQGKRAEAVAEWKKAVELAPSEALAHNNLGVALAELGRNDEAVTHYANALELSPDYPEAHNNLGEVILRAGKPAEAMERFEKALELKPDYASAHSNLGAALARTGRINEALPHFEKSVELKPDDPDVHNNLAVTLALAGRLREAILHLEHAVKLSGGREPMMLDLLARLYADSGRLRNAIAAARRGLAAAVKLNDPRMIAAIRARLAQLQLRAGLLKKPVS